MPFRRAAIVLCLAVMAGCSGSIPRQPVSVEPVADPPRIEIMRWVVVPDFLPREYRIDHVAEVRSTARGVESVDSVSLSVHSSTRFVEDGSHAGLVRSALIRAPRGNPEPVAGLRFPLAYTTSAASPGLIAEPSIPGAMGSCSAANSVLGALRDLFVSLPDSAFRGVSWSARAVWPICRDGAPLELDTTHRYVIVDRDPTAGFILVERSTALAVAGRMIRGADTTLITGSGTGSAMLRLSDKTGFLEELDGTAELRLLVAGAVQREDARQLSRTRIRRQVAAP